MADLDSLKTAVDELGIGNLRNFPSRLNSLESKANSDAVDNEVLKKS